MTRIDVLSHGMVWHSNNERSEVNERCCISCIAMVKISKVENSNGIVTLVR